LPESLAPSSPEGDPGPEPIAFFSRRILAVQPDDIAPDFRSPAKSYSKPGPIDGVRTLRLTRFTDDRGFFFEIFRSRPTGQAGSELAAFFDGVATAQMNYSVVDADQHVKGLHYHLKQDDVWFFPPPSKAKVVMLDVRKSSPTSGRSQVVVAGGGQDLLIRIPAGVAHGYRPLTNPCALLYVVTEVFDPAAPDEYRIAWDHPAVKTLWTIPNG
jgi:dTDP-4-dehydrorhamnose 3,5-epimerase